MATAATRTATKRTWKPLSSLPIPPLSTILLRVKRPNSPLQRRHLLPVRRVGYLREDGEAYLEREAGVAEYLSEVVVEWGGEVGAGRGLEEVGPRLRRGDGRCGRRRSDRQDCVLYNVRQAEHFISEVTVLSLSTIDEV